MSPPGEDMPWRRYKHIDPRRHYVHVRTFLGRRGSFLVLFGVVWIAQGVAAFTAPESTTYALLAHGEQWRSIAWVTTGTIACIYAARPQGEDAPGFLALYLMAAYRAAAYGAGLVLWGLPGGDPGNPRGIVGLLAWGALIIGILIVAGWREYPEDMPRRRGTT